MADGLNDAGRSQERQDGGRGGEGRFPGGRGPARAASVTVAAGTRVASASA